MIRVADYLISYLYKIKTKHIFMLTGGGAMFLDDAVIVNKKIKPICQHHEQCCVMAAEAYSRITGNLGTAIVTSGPGATNAITGVLNAWQDSTPCLIISGQAKRQQIIYNSEIDGLRQLGPQEVNIIPIVKSITKYSELINDPQLIRYFLEKAIYFAKEGRPGPVWLDIPLDVQSSLIDEKKLKGFNPKELIIKKNKPTKKEIDKVIDLLNESKKPLIVVGNGVRLSKSVDQFLELVKQNKLPVVSTVMGIDVIDDDNPLYIGRGGIKGQRAANIAIQNADLIISIGSRLSIPFIGYSYEKFACNAKKIVVDIDEMEHKKNITKIDLLIISDARKFIDELLLKTKNKKFNFNKKWVSLCKAMKDKYKVCLPEYGKLNGKMNMYYIVEHISNFLKKDDIVITDAGSAFYVVSQAFKIKQGQRFIIPGSTGAMGYALPASTGACVANKNSQIICITGDGSFQMNINELITIAHNKLPIKIFIFNNRGYLSIRNTQTNFFKGRYIGESDKSGVGLLDLKKVSKSFNIKYYKANNNKELIKIIPDVIKYNGPVICELMCLEQQLIIPTISSKQQLDGSIVSMALDDMFPFLPKEEMDNIKKDFYE